MRSKLAMLLELGVVAVIVAMLSGCFGDGGSQGTYDGTWTLQFNTANRVLPPAASGATVACFLPRTPTTITLVDGAGTATQVDYCTGTTTPSGETSIPYQVGIAITVSTGAVTAQVNGGTLTGQCISAFSCAANGAAGSLSLTR
jgi:hypothetical protein